MTLSAQEQLDAAIVPVDGVSRPERSEKLAMSVARAIVKDIVARDLPPDTKLPAESVMLADLGIGRASLREALRILEIHGLVVMKAGPRGGPVVGQPSSRHLGAVETLFFSVAGVTYRELIEARMHVEPFMAGLAARCVDPIKLAELRESLSALTDQEPANDAVYLRGCMDFHEVVSTMSGNGVLRLFVTSLNEVWRDRVREVIFPAELRAQVRIDHQRIANAIAKGQSDRAEVFMRQHMEEYVEHCNDRIPGLMDLVIDWR
jgi:GntR family transcriptional repressor for pyruvate dehydrogenase complex